MIARVARKNIPKKTKETMVVVVRVTLAVVIIIILIIILQIIIIINHAYISISVKMLPILSN